MECLLNQGANSAIVNSIKVIYQKAKTEVKIADSRVPIQIHRGVRQGDTMSPKLFSACVEEIFKTLEWDDFGLPINGRRLHHLRFADDIVLFSRNAVEIQKMMLSLAEASEKIGLKINAKKTFLMSNRRRNNILLYGRTVSYVDEFIYLGQRVSFDGSAKREVQRRIRAGWCAFLRYEEIFCCRKIDMKAKRKLYHSCVLPALLYGAETWSLKTTDYDKLATTQRKMERRMVGTTLLDRKTNDWMRGVTKLIDVRREAVVRKWKWAKKIAMMATERWARTLTEWQPLNKKRPQGRPRIRWRDDFRQHFGERWMPVAVEEHRRWRQFMLQHIEMILIL